MKQNERTKMKSKDDNGMKKTTTTATCMKPYRAGGVQILHIAPKKKII